MTDFVDRVRIFVKSGDGGNGAKSFRREKFVPKGGPDGGNGGKGGDVVILADSHNVNLYDLRFKRHHKAKRGGDGGGANRYGRNGEDRVIHVPAGTVVYDERSGEVLADLTTAGESIVVAEGGRGGRGNQSYVSSTNRAPTRADPGKPGEERWLILELKMLAEVGLIGMPSVGKSTMVAAISAARPKIAAYPFTTLSPNLGTVQREFARRYVVADIPGLIEGASEGVGLGHEFLRHIERTRVLVHLLDMDEHTGRDPVEDFDAINDELRAYNEALLDKPQIVVANKLDLPGAKERYEDAKARLAERGIELLSVSAKDGVGLSELLDRVEAELSRDEADALAPALNVLRSVGGSDEDTGDVEDDDDDSDDDES
ncbi:MAG: GTPase ObgE [Deltaproteobacteria bacterium]|nr:GTPase ObgE [bacterium]MCB9477217.1 GTPase ObgE [Deltaproteobacteria bacterium]MCB9488099.1 GTPase ObgE [Deltaproteobacteria bacterium]